jgi:Zn-finger nucleic acid-binding protein
MCRHCDGLWFTRDAIESKKAAILPERTARNRRRAPANDSRACPQCSLKLEPERVDEVVLDVCPQCGGVWLDHGEYKAACRRALTIRLHERAPTLTGKTPKVIETIEQLLDAIVRLHDKYLAAVPDEPLPRLTPRPKRPRR